MSQLLVVERGVVLLEQTIKALLEVQGGAGGYQWNQSGGAGTANEEEMVETLPLLSHLLLVHQELEVEVHQE